MTGLLAAGKPGLQTLRTRQSSLIFPGPIRSGTGIPDPAEGNRDLS
jgi:hypothetical protein